MGHQGGKKGQSKSEVIKTGKDGLGGNWQGHPTWRGGRDKKEKLFTSKKTGTKTYDACKTRSKERPGGDTITCSKEKKQTIVGVVEREEEKKKVRCPIRGGCGVQK